MIIASRELRLLVRVILFASGDSMFLIRVSASRFFVLEDALFSKTELVARRGSRR